MWIPSCDSGEGTRLQQIIDWFGEDFDGLIGECDAYFPLRRLALFFGLPFHIVLPPFLRLSPSVLDECHRAKNCVPMQDGRKKQAESKTSRAVIELQRRCRNARILYVSATG